MHNTEAEESREANRRARNNGLLNEKEGTSPILDELRDGSHPDAREDADKPAPRQRTGVCIGGPMDGRLIAGETNTLKVTENLRPQGVIGGEAVVPTIEHTYYWEGTNTWRHSGMSIPQMISHMAQVYADAAAKRDDGK